MKDGLKEWNTPRMGDSLRMSEIRGKGVYMDVDRDGFIAKDS